MLLDIFYIFIHPFDDVGRGFFDDVLSIMIKAPKGMLFLNLQLIDVSDDIFYLPDMTRGRGRGNTTRASKTLIRGRGSTSRVNMPTVPIPITNSHQGGINSSAGPDQNNQFQTLAPTSLPPVETLAHGSTPYVNFETPPVISNQNNAIGESASTQRNKQFYWDPSIDSEVKILWRKKAAIRYNDFISCIKREAIRPKYVPEETWESWMRFWKDLKVIEKSKINSKNRCGSQNVVAKGTHTGGSITIGEHCKRLDIEKGRDLTLSELHLHVHTHGHDGKYFVGERARNVHEKYLEILQNQTLTQSDVDQLQAYYQAAGGEKKRRIYGLGSQDKSLYGTNLSASASGTDASSSHVRGLISSTSSQPNTHMTHVTSTLANVDEALASVSDED
ncbi:hypothetical protein KY285_030253 [Solanum tuberosum]|nr:hypothetical protein KY285_030253 [Solanum tuberosum]